MECLKKSSPIFSKVFKFILMLVIILFVTVTLISIGVPKWIAFTIIIIGYIFYTAIWPAHIIYRAKSIALIHRYVKSNAHQPIFGYPNALGMKESEEKIEVALKRIINEFADVKDLYRALLAFHQKDSKALMESAENIEDVAYKNYYKGLAFVLKGQVDYAFELEPKIDVKWMRHALRANIAKKRDNLEKFKEEARLAEESARGIQRYTLHHQIKLWEQDFK